MNSQQINALMIKEFEEENQELKVQIKDIKIAQNGGKKTKEMQEEEERMKSIPSWKNDYRQSDDEIVLENRRLKRELTRLTPPPTQTSDLVIQENENLKKEMLKLKNEVEELKRIIQVNQSTASTLLFAAQQDQQDTLSNECFNAIMDTVVDTRSQQATSSSKKRKYEEAENNESSSKKQKQNFISSVIIIID